MIRLFRFLKPYRLSVATIVVLVFLQSLSELALPRLMSDVVDKGVVTGDTSYIMRLGGLMLLVAAGGVLLAIGSSYLSAKASTAFARDLRSKVFARVGSFSLHEFDRFGTATLITRTTNDITQVQQVTVMLMRMAIMAPLMSIGGIVMAVTQERTLSLVLVVAIPVMAAAIGLIMYKGIPLFQAMQVRLDKLNLVAREGLTGIRVVRAFDRIAHEKQRFAQANHDLMDVSVKVNRIMAVMWPLIMLLMNLTTIAVLWFGGIRIDSGHMQIGSLMAFIQYVMQIMFSIVMLSMIMVMAPRAAASAARINEVLQTEPQLKDADQLKQAGAARGYVEFRDVTFSYPGAEEPAIRGVSFAAGPGEVTAIIGGTGSGKSTLVNLIPRFYDVDSGEVLVDGVNVSQMAQADLRAKIGFVPQAALLFSGTVAENIRYGKETATDDEVRRAAEIAQAADFVSALDGGYDSVIAQGGTNLSGGQKQRLTIARALVRRPAIYIFDDNFSALDFKTDAKLRAALKAETAAATVLIVAQRVTTVLDADRIIVLDQGTVAGMGTHTELMRSCQVYREIVASQLGEELA